MKRLFLFSGLLLISGQLLLAQSAPRTVVGNAGDYYENLQFGNLHFTVGEIAVSNLQNGLVLAEGFHQGYYELLVSTADPLPPDWEISVYPNPTVDAVYVRTERSQVARGYLYDQQGRLLQEQPLAAGQATFQLDHLPSGTYWLSLRDVMGAQRSYQVQKVRR